MPTNIVTLPNLAEGNEILERKQKETEILERKQKKTKRKWNKTKRNQYKIKGIE